VAPVVGSPDSLTIPIDAGLPGFRLTDGSRMAPQPMVTDTIMPPVHPGEILLTEFLEPLGVSQYQLAKAVDVPARRINEIVHGQRRISADTALRLSRYFGTSERFWLNLQARYDLEIERTAWARRST